MDFPKQIINFDTHNGSILGKWRWLWKWSSMNFPKENDDFSSSPLQDSGSKFDSWAKWQKPAKYLIRLKKSWNWLVILSPATVSQILDMTPCNHRKRIWCKSVDICLKKLVKARQLNLFFGGFQPFGTTVCLCSLLTADYCVSRRPSTLFAHFWNLSSSGRPKPAIFAVNFAWMPHSKQG